jgi:HK97 family phage major capsid protein
VPYNNVISRTDVEALIPEEVSNRLLGGIVEQSAALSLFPRVPISSATVRMPALAALPTAYWVNGDTGLKQTTEQSWTSKELVVEEIAAIVPIPENVLDDTDFDVWGSIQPRIEEAIGRVLDAAIFFGTNKPASWPAAIVPAAIAAGNVAVRGTSTAAEGGVAGDINDLLATVEADGYDPNGIVTRRTFRSMLRSLRDTTGQKLLDVSTAEIEGIPVRYAMRSLWPTGASAAEMIAGDFSEGMLGVRQDITYKLLDQAVITDAGGLVVYNLPQQDMVAMRVKARYAWQVANVYNVDQPVEANRYPFGVLNAPAA